MTQYIDKSAIVAEIEKLKAYLQIPNAQLEAIQVCDNIISIINTLKGKEVDLEKEINLWIEDNTCNGYCSANICETAEYFFELGLKVQKGE